MNPIYEDDKKAIYAPAVFTNQASYDDAQLSFTLAGGNGYTVGIINNLFNGLANVKYVEIMASYIVQDQNNLALNYKQRIPIEGFNAPIMYINSQPIYFLNTNERFFLLLNNQVGQIRLNNIIQAPFVSSPNPLLNPSDFLDRVIRLQLTLYV